MKKKESRQKLLKMLSNDMRGMRHCDMEDSLPKKAMKVTVAAKDEDGLKKGLEKAEEIMKARKSQGYMDKKKKEE
jgi:hypothetical protein